MSVKTIPMYRVQCDAPGCDASPQEFSDYYAWADSGSAYDDALSGGWTIRPGLDPLPRAWFPHVCMGSDEECPRRDVSEADDGWMYCPDHVDQGMDA